MSSLRIAHRGWHRDHIENTLAAFEAAYSLGCDMVEFDVQLSKDGIPFIFHDDDGKRLADFDTQLCAMTWMEITALQNWIPSLEQFLSQFGHRDFYLEIKIPESKKNVTEYYQTLAEKCADMVLRSKSLKQLSQVPTSTQLSPLMPLKQLPQVPQVPQVPSSAPTYSSGKSQTFLASFHWETLQFLSERNLFPNLAGIFEDYDNFLQAMKQKAISLKYFSVSWEILNRYLTNEAELKNRVGSLNEEEKFFSKILVWNIVGQENFKKAQALNIAGIVTDDVEALLKQTKK